MEVLGALLIFGGKGDSRYKGLVIWLEGHLQEPLS